MRSERAALLRIVGSRGRWPLPGWEGRPGVLVTFLNPNSYLAARGEPALYARFDAILADGISLARLLRACGLADGVRRSFDMTSLAPEVFGAAEREQLGVYLVGARPGLVERTAADLGRRFPKLRIVGSRHGYFSGAADRAAVLEEIRALDPDVVVVGMGVLLQERFLVDLRDLGWSGAGFTCGGFLHQAARRLDYYPAWMDRLHLRSLYRLWDEPHNYRRLLFGVPRFFAVFARDVLELRAAKVLGRSCRPDRDMRDSRGCFAQKRGDV